MAVSSPAQILREAADILARNGRHRGDFYDQQQYDDNELPPSECRVCAYGAIGLAASVDLGNHDFEDPKTAEERAAVQAAWALAEHLGLACVEDDDEDEDDEEFTAALVDGIGGWNDNPATTDAQVLAVLRAAADEQERVERRRERAARVRKVAEEDEDRLARCDDLDGA